MASALAGVFTVLFAYLTMISSNCSIFSAILVSFLIIFGFFLFFYFLCFFKIRERKSKNLNLIFNFKDTAIGIQSRLILLDSFLVVFISGTGLFWMRFQMRKKFNFFFF